MPVLEHRVPAGTKISKQRGAGQPGRGLLPNPPGVAALEEDMPGSLQLTSTKLTVRLVRPSTNGQAVGRPQTVLHRQPGEEAALRRGPSFPNNLLKGAGRGPLKLGFVS
jgi:hypothetical protein